MGILLGQGQGNGEAQPRVSSSDQCCLPYSHNQQIYVKPGSDNSYSTRKVQQVGWPNTGDTATINCGGHAKRRDTRLTGLAGSSSPIQTAPTSHQDPAAPVQPLRTSSRPASTAHFFLSGSQSYRAAKLRKCQRMSRSDLRQTLAGAACVKLTCRFWKPYLLAWVTQKDRRLVEEILSAHEPINPYSLAFWPHVAY